MSIPSLAATLARTPTDAGAWEAFLQLSEDQRVSLVHELKGHVDNLLRTSPREALAAGELLFRAGKSAPAAEALSLRGYGNALHFNARYAEARQILERAVEAFALGGDTHGAATTRRNLVDVLMYLGDSKSALQVADAARDEFAQVGSADDLARLENNVGNVHLRLDEYPAARTHYDRAREHFRATQSQLGVGITSFNLGIVEMNANDVEASERDLRTARDAFVAADMEMHVADCDYNLAYLLSRRGRFADAILGLEDARETYQRIGKPSGPPLCDLDLAEIYLRLDARRNAVEYADRAAEGFRDLELRYEAARCDVLAGLALLRLGSTNEAHDRLQEAAEAFRQLGNEAAAAAVDVQRGAIELKNGAAAEARARLRLARDELERRELRFLTDLAGVTLARAHLACGDASASRLLLEGLLDRGEDNAVFDQLLRAEALSLLSTARRSEGDDGGATDALREAVEATEQSYGQIHQSDLRVAFFRDRHLAYVELIWDLAESGREIDRTDALRLLEESRGRSLREERPPAVNGRSELTRARARLDWLLSRQVSSELGEGQKDHELRLGTVDDSLVLQAQDEVLRLARSESSTAERPAELAPDLFDAARGPGDVLVFFLVAPRGTRALLVDENGVTDFRLDITAREISRLRDRLWLHVDKLRLGRAYLRARGARLEQSIAGVLDALGEGLIAPLMPFLEGREAVLVPFGDLHDVPLSALRVGGEPLAMRAEVSSALSAASLAAARAAQSHGNRRIACGAPVGSLDAIEAELRDLGELHPPLETLAPDELIGGLEDGSLRGSLLHVAAHAHYSHQRPELSGLSLGDRFLLAHDIMHLGMPFDLVVLSGCETGRRRRIPGEELRGLTRALQVAGPRAMIGSLWAVEDSATRTFMAALHTELASGTPLRRAVNRTQRALRASGAPTTTWAAFTAFGDPGLRLPPAPTPPTTRNAPSVAL